MSPFEIWARKNNLFITIIIMGLLMYKGVKYLDQKGRNNLIQGAIESYNSKDYITSKNQLRKFIREFGETPDVLAFLGTIYFEEENDSLAEIQFTKALNLDSVHSKSLSGIGLIHKNKGDYVSAEKYYWKSINSDPKNAKAYGNLALLYLYQHKNSDALSYGIKALELSPSDLPLKGNMTIIYHFNGMKSQRDKLMLELEKAGYEYIDALRAMINLNSLPTKDGLLYY
jgi:tetratricopeptide (TPR) repeat protein